MWRHEIRRMGPKNSQDACHVHPAVAHISYTVEIPQAVMRKLCPEKPKAMGPDIYPTEDYRKAKMVLGEKNTSMRRNVKDNQDDLH